MSTLNTIAAPALLIAAGLALLAAFLYWHLVIAEGAYLGRAVVRFLYDRFAPRYDAVKEFNPSSDALALAAPVLRHDRNGEVLDVATGTGRLPAALLAQPKFSGRIVALDDSSRMLNIARQKLSGYGERVDFVQGDACAMRFEPGRFSTAACLEALEFMRDPDACLRAMFHALRPGGLLLVSNRIGPDAWKLPGRAIPTTRFAGRLAALGFERIETHSWLVDYDLLTAHRPL
jgi:ubiquinone/menaquinone biosynthesis C-methylase UbiE